MSANDDDIDNYFRAMTSEGVMAMSANTDDVDSSSGGGGSSCAANYNFHVAILISIMTARGQECHHYHLPNECIFTTNRVMTNMEDDDIHGSGKWWWEMMRGKMSHR